jgi:hypothetical protein
MSKISKIIESVPEYVRNVKGPLDENLFSPNFNYDMVIDYYTARGLHYKLTNRLMIDEDIIAIKKGKYRSLEFEYGTMSYSTGPPTSVEEYFDRRLTDLVSKMVNGVRIEAVKVHGGAWIYVHSQSVKVNQSVASLKRLGFAFGDICCDSYYVENTDNGPDELTVHYNSKDTDICFDNITRSMAVLKCGHIDDGENTITFSSPHYIHYAETRTPSVPAIEFGTYVKY